MATCRDIIKDALGMLGVLAAGEDPSGVETEDALNRLRVLLSRMPMFGMSNGMNDVLIDAPYTAGEDERISFAGVGNVAVTLPDTLRDRWTGKLRIPRNGARVQVTGLGGANYVYIASKGSWLDISNILLETVDPIGYEHNDGLAAILAVALAPFYGATIQPTTSTSALMARYQISHDFDTVREPLESSYF